MKKPRVFVGSLFIKFYFMATEYLTAKNGPYLSIGKIQLDDMRPSLDKLKNMWGKRVFLQLKGLQRGSYFLVGKYANQWWHYLPFVQDAECPTVLTCKNLPCHYSWVRHQTDIPVKRLTLSSACLCQITNEATMDFIPVITVHEWIKKPMIEQFMKLLCTQLDLVTLEAPSLVVYHCRHTRGYFLQGETYIVWASLVCENQIVAEHYLLLVDYYSGIPEVVDFRADVCQCILK